MSRESLDGMLGFRGMPKYYGKIIRSRNDAFHGLSFPVDSVSVDGELAKSIGGAIFVFVVVRIEGTGSADVLGGERERVDAMTVSLESFAKFSLVVPDLDGAIAGGGVNESFPSPFDGFDGIGVAAHGEFASFGTSIPDFDESVLGCRGVSLAFGGFDGVQRLPFDGGDPFGVGFHQSSRFARGGIPDD